MSNNRLPIDWATISFAILLACSAQAEEKGFPFILPTEKPNRPMSAAVERNYTAYMAPRPEENELFSSPILTSRSDWFACRDLPSPTIRSVRSRNTP